MHSAIPFPRVFALVPVLAAMLAGAAAAEGTLPFQTPDGNVHCRIVFDSDRNHVRCDMLEADKSFADPPEDCDQDWGLAFEVGVLGPGRPICAGDSVVDPDVQKMPPGYSHGIGGVICFSEEQGMTCMNAEAHGFTLTRDAQIMF